MLHVWVEWITFLLGKFILRILVAGCLLANVEPSIKKRLVAPESEMAYFTARHTFRLLKMAAAIGSSCKLFFCMMVFHSFDLMGMEVGGGVMICTMGVIAGILISQAGLDVRYGI